MSLDCLEIMEIGFYGQNAKTNDFLFPKLFEWKHFLFVLLISIEVDIKLIENSFGKVIQTNTFQNWFFFSRHSNGTLRINFRFRSFFAEYVKFMKSLEPNMLRTIRPVGIMRAEIVM